MKRNNSIALAISAVFVLVLSLFLEWRSFNPGEEYLTSHLGKSSKNVRVELSLAGIKGHRSKVIVDVYHIPVWFILTMSAFGVVLSLLNYWRVISISKWISYSLIFLSIIPVIYFIYQHFGHESFPVEFGCYVGLCGLVLCFIYVFKYHESDVIENNTVDNGVLVK